MRILIDQGGYRFKNVGDEAMLRVTCNQIKKRIPDAELTIIAKPDVNLREHDLEGSILSFENRDDAFRYGYVLGRKNKLLWAIDKHLARTRPQFYASRLNRKKPLPGHYEKVFEAVRSSDVVVCSGGGFITDSFPEMVYGVGGIFKIAHELGIPTAMFGQGFGPFNVPRHLQFACSAFRSLSFVSLRENLQTPLVAKQFGIPEDRFVVTGDDATALAFSVKPDQIGDKIGFNIRIARYSGVQDDRLADIGKVYQSILSETKASPVILPIDISESHGDLGSTQRALGLDPASETSPYNLDRVVSLAGQCRLVITGSYHAAVFALAQGASVIAVTQSAYYAAKFKGLQDFYGEGCKCIDLSQAGALQLLQAEALESWAQAETRRTSILARSEKITKDCEAAYDRFFNMVIK